MFYTRVDSEIAVPTSLKLAGKNCWPWVELPAPCCYFLITVREDVDDESFVYRHFLVGTIEETLTVEVDNGPGFRLIHVDLLRPRGYLWGEDGYRLDRLAEIWRETTGRNGYRFKLESGALAYDNMRVDQFIEQEFELIRSL